MSETKIVIYQSKYGSTERYAKRLAEDLGCEAVRSGCAKKLRFDDYGTVIFGGGLYAGGIGGVSLITSNWDALKHKRVAVFTVGLADPASADYKPIIDKAFNDEQKRAVRVFHLQGGIDYKKLSLAHRAAMGMLVTILKRKNDADRSEEDTQLIATYGKAVDFVNFETLQPIKDYVSRQEKE